MAGKLGVASAADADVALARQIYTSGYFRFSDLFLALRFSPTSTG